MYLQFESGEGRYFNGGVNFIKGYDVATGEGIYAEIATPEDCSEDYGYITMKKAILKALLDNGYKGKIRSHYDGQEQFLAEDADVDADVYVIIE